MRRQVWVGETGGYETGVETFVPDSAPIAQAASDQEETPYGHQGEAHPLIGSDRHRVQLGLCGAAAHEAWQVRVVDAGLASIECAGQASGNLGWKVPDGCREGRSGRGGSYLFNLASPPGPSNVLHLGAWATVQTSLVLGRAVLEERISRMGGMLLEIELKHNVRRQVRLDISTRARARTYPELNQRYSEASAGPVLGGVRRVQ